MPGCSLPPWVGVSVIPPDYRSVPNKGRLQDYPTGTPCSTFHNKASCNQLHCLVIPIKYVFKLQTPIGVFPFKAHRHPSIRSFSHTGPTGHQTMTAIGSELCVNFTLFRTIIYWSTRSTQHVSGYLLPIFRSVRLRFLQHMVSCCCGRQGFGERQSGTTRGELSYLAPLGSENISAPYFKQCFFGGGVLPPPPRLSQTPRLPVPRQK